MIKSFILTPDTFTDPDDSSGKIMRESGIEDRYKEIFERCDSNFWVNKLDWSDGVIRYVDENSGNLLFWGIQECKIHGTSSLNSRLAQGLYYVWDRICKYPSLKESAKLIFLPTEKYIDIFYLDNVLQTSLWDYLNLHCVTHRLNGGSASNFYKKEGFHFIPEIIDNLQRSRIVLDREVDFKIVIEDILKNCL